MNGSNPTPLSIALLALAAQSLTGCLYATGTEDVTADVQVTAEALTGTWTRVGAPFPDGPYPGNLTLLPDGRVLCSGPETSNLWYTLTPDGNGSYANGTWSGVESSNQGRLFNPSFTLRDGRYLNCGGEYVLDEFERRQHSAGTDRARCEIFDPVTDSWSVAPDMPQTVADTPATVLGDGRVLNLSYVSSNSYLFSSFQTTPSWSLGPSYDRSAIDNEGGCVQLPDGGAFCGNKRFQRYVPGLFGGPGSWVAAATTPGLATGEFLPTPDNGEIGAFMLLHTGKVMVLGGNQLNGLYTPPAFLVPDSWTLAANTPAPFNHADAPATVEPDNKVFTATTTDATGLGAGAVTFYEYDPSVGSAGSWTLVPPPTSTTTFPSAERTRLLNLPRTNQGTGQILVTGSSDGVLWLYQPSGTPQTSWKPTLSSISAPVAGEFTLNGTQLNGLTTGAEFGDDGKMATNFPVVTLMDTAGHVYFARSYNYDQMAPRRATAGSCKFVLPTNLPNGTYQVHASANGVDSSNTLSLTVSGMHVVALSGSPLGANVGSSVTWAVLLSGPAPAGGTVVNLSSSATNVATVPASVTVPQGQTAAAFNVTTRGFGKAIISAVTATANAQFKAATRKFGWTIRSLDAPGIVYGESSATWTISLSNQAPPSGISVSLSSSNTAVATVPATVTIPGGQTTATFVLTNRLHEDQTTTITASLLSSSMSRVATGVTKRIGDMDFRKCANENQTCVVGAVTAGADFTTQYVAFGANGAFNFLSVLGSVPCDVAHFGDPLPGVVKACYFAPYGFKGNENVQINVPAGTTVNVAFGANGAFKYKQMSASFTCNVATFEDPLKGVAKACYFGPNNYSFVTNEGGTMSLSTLSPIAYGNNGNFVFKLINGGTATCDNATFGDPSPGAAKSCYRFNYPFRADEGQPYSGQGQSFAYYGSGLNGAFMISGDASGTCSNAFFGGDPDVGHVKHCWEQ